MQYNSIEILPNGCLRLQMIPPFFSDILAQLPSILEGEIPIEGAPDAIDPEKQLFPSIYPARELLADEDWRKYARPDLIALFASRREIIDQDLDSLIEDFYLVPFLEQAQRLDADSGGEVDEDDEGAEEFVELFGQLARPIMPLHRLLIPASHRSAWMSSLNAARLLIAQTFGFMDAMPERSPHYDPHDPEQLALLLMDALGELEHLLVEVDRQSP